MARTDRKELFKFMIDRVSDVASLSFLDEPRAFTKWFLTLYCDLGPGVPIKISDGAGDGKIDAFTEKSVAGSTRSILVNSKFTETFDQIAPPKFYDEIIRFRRAFEDSEARQEYLDTVKVSFRDSFEVFFDRYDEGLADLIFVTNHRVNPKQIESIKNVGVKVLHLDDLLQYMAD